jgi:hypothetical protein
MLSTARVLERVPKCSTLLRRVLGTPPEDSSEPSVPRRLCCSASRCTRKPGPGPRSCRTRCAPQLHQARCACSFGHLQALRLRMRGSSQIQMPASGGCALWRSRCVAPDCSQGLYEAHRESKHRFYTGPRKGHRGSTSALRQPQVLIKMTVPCCGITPLLPNACGCSQRVLHPFHINTANSFWLTVLCGVQS